MRSLFLLNSRLNVRFCSHVAVSARPKRFNMTKKKSSTPGEENLLLPTPPSTAKIVDTHTHLASTFQFYQTRYKEGQHKDVFSFLRAMYEGRNVEAIVDVWCEAPVRPMWKEFADSALSKEDRESKWAGIEYWFALGVFRSILSGVR